VTVQTPTTVDLSKYIDTHFFGERPHIRGRRVPVATIAYSARSQDWDVAELAYQFTLSTAQVLSALLYYEEHQAKIDAQEAEEAALFDEEYRKHHGKD
jgi:uncharacterized protein (DUF433 family)